MRILLVTYWYLPHVGGVNVYVNLLRDELRKRGHEVDVLAHHPKMDKIYMPTSGKFIQKKKIKDVVYKRVYNFYSKAMPYVESWVRWREIERYTFELAASLFDLDQYELIHTQDIVSTRALARVKPAHVPLISTIHGLLATEHIIAGDITDKESLAWKYVSAEEYTGATSSDATIVPTRWLADQLSDRAFGVPRKRLTTIPYGMDSASFLKQFHAPSRSLPNVPEGKKVLICPARLVPVKGHRYLLEGLAKLKQQRNDFICWLVGGGELRAQLNKLVQKLKLQDVVYFLGSRKDVPQLMHHSDIVILPSVQDNHPFSIMEAQVGGKPVLASDAGGIPEMVKDGLTGFLFEKEDSAALAQKLHRILSQPELIKKVALQGMYWGRKRWAPSTLLDATWKVYERALQNRPMEGKKQ